MNYERLDIVQVIKDNPLSNLTRQYETKLIIDYKIALLQAQKRKNEGGFNKENILLTINTCVLI
jgi:hypothetical protein